MSFSGSGQNWGPVFSFSPPASAHAFPSHAFGPPQPPPKPMRWGVPIKETKVEYTYLEGDPFQFIPGAHDHQRQGVSGKGGTGSYVLREDPLEEVCALLRLSQFLFSFLLAFFFRGYSTVFDARVLMKIGCRSSTCSFRSKDSCTPTNNCLI